MEEHKQYNLGDERENQNNGQNFDNGFDDNDWISAPNVVRTDKDLIIKDFHNFTDTEAYLGKGQKIKIKYFKSGDDPTYNILLEDYFIGVTDTIISRTVKLTNPNLAGIGKLYVISDLSGSALSTTISITPFSTELINGDTSTAINTNYGTIRLTTNGTNWFIIN